MSEQLQTEINDLIIERLAQLQSEVDHLRVEVDKLKTHVRASTIHPEMFTHGR